MPAVLDLEVEELWRRLSARNSQPGETPMDRAALESALLSWEPPTEVERLRYDPPLTGQ